MTLDKLLLRHQTIDQCLKCVEGHDGSALMTQLGRPFRSSSLRKSACSALRRSWWTVCVLRADCPNRNAALEAAFHAALARQAARCSAPGDTASAAR